VPEEDRVDSGWPEELASGELESAPEFLSVPSRTLFIEEAANASDVRDLPTEPITVVESEEWIRVRDQIALIVRSTVAEAILPLQQAIASIAQRLDVDVPAGAERLEMKSAPTCPPPAPCDDAPPLPPMAPSALMRLGELAGKLRRERGIDVSPMQLAALVLERVASVLDERVAAELANSSTLRASTSSRDDHSS
jgi:hypothetical protein